MTPTEEARFIELWNAGTETAEMGRQLGIPRGTVQSRAHRLQQQGKIQPRPKGGAYPRQKAQTRALTEGTPSDQTGHTGAHPSTPLPDPTSEHPSTPAISRRHTEDHPGTPHLSIQQPTTEHPSTPSLESTQAHPGVPVPNDLAVRLLSLLPDLEVIVARERDRQRLLSTPVGTPQHTVKKTYVVEALYVDLIERYAQAEGVELKDVVNLAFHEFFERRHYLPAEVKR
jgi:hypothetical protein